MLDRAAPREKMMNAPQRTLAIAAIMLAIAAPASGANTITCPIGQSKGPTPPVASQRGFYAGEDTAITVTSVVPPDPNLIPGSVTLIQVDSNGNEITSLGQSTNLGQMYDDGTHGDAVAADGIYTAQATIHPKAAGKIYLAVTASYSGPPGCRQSFHNERELFVAGHKSTQAEDDAETNVLDAAADFMDNEEANGISQMQAAQDTVNYIMANYGPNGSTQAGFVSQASVNPTAVEITYASGHGAVISFH
ncbi:MAG TPA: choice-of-anchor X domain-containing protein [Candidatus Binataceae bacterium]|nr:choice-of-anchor X domain-containing protein [Candidatus Binataceae bacterium]